VGRQPTCGFCEGTGLWLDPDVDPGFPDPCPLCDGSGQSPKGLSASDPPAADPPSPARTLDEVLPIVPELPQAERQRLYELLHARYDCRIYR
jgi:hypothetical protein